MSRRLLAVTRREFTARVHTRTFVITTVLIPLLMIAVAVVAVVLVGAGQPEQATRIAVVDGAGGSLAQRIADTLDAQSLGKRTRQPRYDVTIVPAVGDVAEVRDRLVAQTGFSPADTRGRFDGVLVLGPDALATGKLAYYGNDASSPAAMQQLRSSLSKAFAGQRLAHAGLNVDLVTHAMRPVSVVASKVSAGKLTGNSGMATFFVAYAMCFLLYFVIVMFGQQTMTSVIEEKTSRVVEVLVSALTPFQMLLGKVLGVGGAGLLQMAIWGAFAWFITTQAALLAGFAGIGADGIGSLLPHIHAGLVGVFLAYFVLGFLLYGALFAAVGSMCNSVQDSQQYVIVVSLLILVGFIAAFAVIQNPNGTLGQVFSWIPFFAPFVVPVRASLTAVPPMQLAGSLVLMGVGIVVCGWLAGRIYRVGILMFGKKPTWRELWRWIRVG